MTSNFVGPLAVPANANLRSPASFKSKLDFGARRINQQGLEQTLQRQSAATDITPHSAERRTACGLSAVHTTKTAELLPHSLSLCTSRLMGYIHVRQYKILCD